VIYKAFISYSHQADQRLAAALQDALQQFAKPYYALRAFNIFRDQTDLSANPSLWPKIASALDSSEFFLLMASSKSAQSNWVKREIDHWLRAHQGKPSNLILLWTDGKIVWDTNRGDFDWELTDSLPRVLDWEPGDGHPLSMSGVFRDQPFYVDMTWTRNRDELSLRDPEFLDSVGTIAAELHGLSKSTLVGRDVTEHKRFRRARFGAILGLALLAITATVFAVSAYLDRNKARSAQALAEQRLKEADIAREAEKTEADHERIQREIAESRAFANAAYALSDRDPSLSLRFAEAAVSKAPKGKTESDTTTTLSLLKAFNSGSWFYGQRFDGAKDADLSNDGNHLAWIEGTHTLHLLDLRSMADSRRSIPGSHVRFLSDGDLVVWHSWKGMGTFGNITLLGPTGNIIAQHKFEFLAPIICQSGQVMVPSFSQSERMAITVLDSRSKEVRSFELPAEMHDLGLMGACLPNGRGVAVTQTIPGVVVLADLDGRKDVLHIPQNYISGDLDLNRLNGRVAVYLTGTVRGMTDAVGWVDLHENTGSELTLKMVSLPNSPGEDTGGILRFLPDGRVIAASSAGWTRLVNLDTGESVQISNESRATDQIGILPKDNLIVLARRSGTASVYSLPDIQVGRLLGELHSNGLNILFTHLAVDSTGSKLLTVSRNGARVWLRPRYNLVLPHSRTDHIYRKIPSPALAFLQSLQSRTADLNAVPCDDNITIRIDDLGQRSLCVSAAGRIDYLSTGIAKDDLSVMVTGPEGDSIFRISTERADHLIVVSPELVLNFIKEEGRDRLWFPDSDTQKLWSGSTMSQREK
jgi:hypothetical protein